MSNFALGRKGLELDAPQVGEIVSMHVRPRSKPRSDSYSDSYSGIGVLVRSDHDEAESPQHYAMTTLWKVLATNGGQVVVEQAWPVIKPDSWDWKFRRRMFPVHLYRWFEASALLETVRGDEQPAP